MKINETQRIGALNQYNRFNEAKTADRTGKKEKLKDAVQISPEAKELLENQGAASASSERIEHLKQSVSSGTYHVESGKIAEKLWPYIK